MLGLRPLYPVGSDPQNLPYVVGSRSTYPLVLSAWTGAHRLLVDRARFDVGYRTKVFDDLAREPIADTLVLLTGPRRVGKHDPRLDRCREGGPRWHTRGRRDRGAERKSLAPG